MANIIRNSDETARVEFTSDFDRQQNRWMLAATSAQLVMFDWNNKRRLAD